MEGFRGEGYRETEGAHRPWGESCRRMEVHVQLCILCLLLFDYAAAVNQREDLVRSITRINQ